MRPTYYIVGILLVAGVFAFVKINSTRSCKVQSPFFDIVLKLLLPDGVPLVSVSEAQKNKEAIFLDAREEAEFNVSHIQNSRLVGYKNFTLQSLTGVPKDQQLIVYCSIGKRSDVIAERLIKEGYTNIRNLYGGLFEWVNEGHEVYDRAGKLTQNVHAYNFLWAPWLNVKEKIY